MIDKQKYDADDLKAMVVELCRQHQSAEKFLKKDGSLNPSQIAKAIDVHPCTADHSKKESTIRKWIGEIKNSRGKIPIWVFKLLASFFDAGELLELVFHKQTKFFGDRPLVSAIECEDTSDFMKKLGSRDTKYCLEQLRARA